MGPQNSNNRRPRKHLLWEESSAGDSEFVVERRVRTFPAFGRPRASCSAINDLCLLPCANVAPTRQLLPVVVVGESEITGTLKDDDCQHFPSSPLLSFIITTPHCVFLLRLFSCNCNVSSIKNRHHFLFFYNGQLTSSPTLLSSRSPYTYHLSLRNIREFKYGHLAYQNLPPRRLHETCQ